MDSGGHTDLSDLYGRTRMELRWNQETDKGPTSRTHAEGVARALCLRGKGSRSGYLHLRGQAIVGDLEQRSGSQGSSGVRAAARGSTGTGPLPR